MMKNLGKLIEAGVLFFCALVLLNVGIYFVGLVVGVEPLDYGKAAFLALMGAAAIYFGMPPTRSLFLHSLLDKRGSVAANNDDVVATPVVARGGKLSWRPVVMASAAIGGMTSFLCYVFIASSGDLRLGAATFIVGLSTIAFFFSRFRLIRERVSNEGISASEFGHLMTVYFGGKALVVWLVSTILLVVVVLLV